MNNSDYYRRRSKYKKKKRQAELAFFLAISVIVALILLITIVAVSCSKKKEKESPARNVDYSTEYEKLYVADQPDLQVELLTVNSYSRPGDPINDITGIVIHWTANPGTTAMQNRNYFEGLKDTHKTKASAHFVIGLEGEIVQCIPCKEISYASNDRNYDTISIECCIEDADGEFNAKTYESLLHLTTWLMGRYDLTVDDVIRHYDVTGKDCPKYYVDNEDAWEKLKMDLDNYIATHGVPKGTEPSTE